MINIEHYTTEDQDPKVVERILGKLQDLLFNDEEIIYLAVQKKPAVNLLPDCIAVCSRRLFYCTPSHLGLTTNFKDITWRNIKEVSFKEGLLGAKFICVPLMGENIITDYLPKAQARKLYQAVINQMDADKNSLETTNTEIVATESSSNPISESTMPEMPMAESSSQDDIDQKLIKLKSLYEKQLISREEYEAKKAAILDTL